MALVQKIVKTRTSKFEISKLLKSGLFFELQSSYLSQKQQNLVHSSQTNNHLIMFPTLNENENNKWEYLMNLNDNGTVEMVNRKHKTSTALLKELNWFR